MIGWLIKKMKPAIHEAVKDLAPVIKEIAIEAAKAYVAGEMAKLEDRNK
jgi:hypothetical protein